MSSCPSFSLASWQMRQNVLETAEELSEVGGEEGHRWDSSSDSGVDLAAGVAAGVVLVAAGVAGAAAEGAGEEDDMALDLLRSAHLLYLLFFWAKFGKLIRFLDFGPRVSRL